MRPFRFGVNLRAADSRADWVDKARRVEALGYSTLLVPDHLAELFPPLLPLAAADLADQWPALSVDDVLDTPYLLIGTVDQMVEALQRRRERWGISYLVTHEPFLEPLAPVVARLAGV